MSSNTGTKTKSGSGMGTRILGLAAAVIFGFGTYGSYQQGIPDMGLFLIGAGIAITGAWVFLKG